LSEFSDWMKDTDLDELFVKTDGCSIRLGAGNEPGAPVSVSDICPVLSPSVGIFYFSAKGQTSAVSVGMHVKLGDRLGLVKLCGDEKPVLAKTEGFLKNVLIQDGQPVEYGSPLFFIEPGTIQ